MIKRYAFLFGVIFLPFVSLAQLVISPNNSATSLAQNIIGGGVTVSNTSLICGNDVQGPGSATFTYSGTNLGIFNGILLSTAPAWYVANPGGNFSNYDYGLIYNDPSLLSIESAANHDVCILQFDFVPICNSISITYVFGSEEHPDYQCSVFNDAFGIFLTGPGYANANIATIPGNIPVSINNINDGSIWGFCWPTAYNPAYFVNNYSAPNSQIVYNGYTIPITSTRTVTPCSTYTMKIAIGDATDGLYDSGVFVKSSSVGCSTPPVVTATATTNNCNQNNGTAGVTVTNYTGTVTYNWSPGGATTSTIGGLGTGVYTCTVGLAGTCSVPYTTVVTTTVTASGTTPTVSISGTQNFCSGTSTQ